MRTDSELECDVRAELAWEPGINAMSVDVSVRDGIVMLAGAVSNYPEKLLVEKVPKRIAGVKGVVAKITVNLPPGLNKCKDSEIKRVAATILKWNVSVPDDRILLSVKNGCITLTGEVNWQYQKIALETALSYIRGLTSIINNVAIIPRANITQARTSIESALNRNAWVNQRKISVDADGGRVTLSGESSSWEEFDEAERAAWALPGVRMVRNQLLLTDKIKPANMGQAHFLNL